MYAGRKVLVFAHHKVVLDAMEDSLMAMKVQSNLPTLSKEWLVAELHRVADPWLRYIGLSTPS